MTRLAAIEGIGEVYEKKLKEIGVTTVEDLLKKGATPHGRKELAEKSGVGDVRILEWVNRADLFRIKGIGEEYSDLLEAAGVDTVPELAQRVPEHLLKKFQEVNAVKKVVRQLPALTQVEDWVAQAKKLPRVVTY